MSNTPNSRPVHPCYLSVFEGTSGVEFSEWAYICTTRSTSSNNNNSQPPDLVTAHSNTLTVYSVDASSGKLLVQYRYSKLAGTVCFLKRLEAPSGADSLVIGFAGHPRLVIVQATPDKLVASTLIDLTPALQERTYGAVTPLEQDLEASLLQRSPTSASICVILGGGVAVACLQLKWTKQNGSWTSASPDPYLLPLQKLSAWNNGGLVGADGNSGQQGGSGSASNNINVASIVTGFGDVMSATFLPGYMEPTVALLHGNPECGATWPGRLGRSSEQSGTRNSLVVTSLSVTVAHERSAVLWKAEVPADAIRVYGIGSHGCMVQCVNSLVHISNTGQILQCLALNGFAKSGMSLPMQKLCRPNPWPFPRLSISLDGAEFSFPSDSIAICTLRYGHVYLLQCTDSTWSMLPLYTSVGAIGQVACASCWPLGTMSYASAMDSKLFGSSTKNTTTATEASSDVSKTTPMQVGLFFVGSRLGDSSLLGYALESASVGDMLQRKESSDSPIPKLEDPSGQTLLATASVEDDYDSVLRIEEEALYAETTDDGTTMDPDIVPPSDDDESSPEAKNKGEAPLVSAIQTRKRPRLSEVTLVRSLTALDSLTALGPLGPSCSGPISKAPVVVNDSMATPSYGSMGHIHPCGHGSSGGLALLTTPGRDDRSILVEEDCINATAMFHLPMRQVVLLNVANDGVRVLNLENGSKATLAEIGLSEWVGDEASLPFMENEVLSVVEMKDDKFCVLFATRSEQGSEKAFSIVVFEGKDAAAHTILASHQLPVPDGATLTQVTEMTETDNVVVLAYVLSTGEGHVLLLDSIDEYSLSHVTVPSTRSESESSGKQMSDAESEFYSVEKIVAMDVFYAPATFFRGTDRRVPNGEHAESTTHLDDCQEEEYDGLYVDAKDSMKVDSGAVDEKENLDETLSEPVPFLGLCRQSGWLEIYAIEDMMSEGAYPVLWQSRGCGHGVDAMTNHAQTQNESPSWRRPRMYQVATCELRFLFCGETAQKNTLTSGSRNFCLVLETNLGDTHVYTATLNQRTTAVTSLRRLSLSCPTRPSIVQLKHFSKLRRKGIVGKNDEGASLAKFRWNVLHKFYNFSGQDGVFVAGSRPFWLIADRGQPVHIYHRSKHAAPAGAKTNPVTGFCQMDLAGAVAGCLTLHERVGRVGSQRITLFESILSLSSPNFCFPGGGLCVEKITMGVTVRQVLFIDCLGAGVKPVYAVLVSREVAEDLTALNDDGLTAEERRQIVAEKESAKIKRQVEADLGGFDMEQEWIEEIERENCFGVETELGGAPPTFRSVYSLWIVDATNGWVVLDSYELDEDEHGLTMAIAELSEFTEEPGNTASEITEKDLATRQFIAVGTGIVDKNGEDVSSKGRVILLQVRRSNDFQSIDLDFVYEKKIFHGPITTLVPLSVEGHSRLVIGAGADVNIEQWGNEKLTQVGFFRATMHILDVKLFKNFLVLSDAYDSLYFLVWRESDKSLTLLAKNYDPTPVFASGLVSRGGSLDLICHDDRQNLQFFQYAPGDPAARGGNKLVCRADFHLGSQTSHFHNFLCRSSLSINSASPTSTLAALKQQDAYFGRADDDQRRLAAHFGTSDGSCGAIVPLSEPVYWRMTALQSVMANAVESDCSLSSRAWRLYRRTPRRGGCRSNERKKGVIDGDVVMQFLDLPLVEQEDLASSIGSTVELMYDNLLELKCSSLVI